MAAITQRTVSVPRYCPFIQFNDAETPFINKGRFHPSDESYLYSRSEIPKEAHLKSAHKAIPDFVSINGHFGMCGEAREAIEALEPGVHQFMPVSIVRERGKQPIFRLDGRILESPYYFFNCQVRLDAVLIDESDALLHTYPNGEIGVLRDISKRTNRLVLSRKVIGTHHVWKGGLHLPGTLFFSNHLAGIVSEKKWRKLDFEFLGEE